MPLPAHSALPAVLTTVLATLTVPTTPPGAATPQPPAGAPRAGTLTITAPATTNLGTVTIGGQLSAHLGTVTVTAQGTNTWTATVTATTFTTTGGTIPNNDIRYWSGPATATTGPGTFTPSQPTAAQAVPLNASRTAFSRTGSNAQNSCSWNPTLIVTVPNTAVAGTYTGTITHSVA